MKCSELKRGMKVPTRAAVLALIAGLVAGPATPAAGQQATATVAGVVVEQGSQAPIAGAVVRVEGTERSTVTNASGRFVLTSVPAGTHVLVAERPGYTELRRSGVVVEAGAQATTVTLEMTVSAFTMDRLQVTATKDPIAVGDVPALVSVVSAEEMAREGNVELTNALEHVPGLIVSSAYASFQSVQLRGMPRTGNEFTTTLLLIDGVPQTDSRNSARVVNLPTNDVANVEVVRGPNSALYGRTAIGGVVNIMTNDPTPELTGQVELQGGSFGHLKGKGTVSGPLGQSAGFNVSAATGRSEGYFEQDFEPRFEEHSVYGKLAFSPRSGHDGFVSANYVTSDNAVPTPVPVINGRPLTEIDPSYSPHQNLNIPEANYHQEEARATFNYTLPLGESASLTNITGFRRIQYKFEDDGDQVGSPFDLSQKMFTMYAFELQTDEDIFYQEARISWQPALPVENSLLVGGSFEHNEGFSAGNLLYTDEETLGWPISYENPVIPPRSEWQEWPFGGNDYSSNLVGAYVQYMIEPFARLLVTGGIRYDRASLVNVQTRREGQPRIEDSWSAVSPKISSTFKLIEAAGEEGMNLNVYATYSEAFLPPRVPGSLAPADAELPLVPEDVRNYEVGLKAELPGARLYMEGAYFNMKRDGIIVSTREGPLSRPSNAGEQDFEGAELSANWSPIPSLSVYGNAAFYNHRYGDFVIQLPSGDNDVTGNQLELSSDRIYNAGATWTHESGFGATVGLKHVGERYLDRDNTFLIDPYTELEASLNWQRGPVRLTLAGKNLTDERYITAGDISLAQSVDFAPPRQLLLIANYTIK